MRAAHCTTYVQRMYNVCTISVQFMYYVCKTYKQRLYNFKHYVEHQGYNFCIVFFLETPTARRWHYIRL